ncbi:MAG: hypothetical protein R2717_08915 [Schumannella sp.]
MSVISDLNAARKVVRNAIRSRRNRRIVEQHMAEHPPSRARCASRCTSPTRA